MFVHSLYTNYEQFLIFRTKTLVRYNGSYVIGATNESR